MTESTPGELIKTLYSAEEISVLKEVEEREAYDKMHAYVINMLKEQEIFDIVNKRIAITNNGTIQIYCSKSIRIDKNMLSGLENIFGHNNIYMTETQSRKKNEGNRIINISNE